MTLALQAYRAEEVRQKVIASEERYAELIRTVGGFSWETDALGVYTYASPSILDVIGWAPEDVVGKKTCFDLLAPEDRPLIEDVAQKMLAGGHSMVSLENTMIRRDGTPVVVSTTGFPLRDSAGRIVGFRGIDLDMTRWKTVEEERESANARVLRQRTALAALASKGFKERDGGNFLRLITETIATALKVSRASHWEFRDDGATLCCTDLYDATSGGHSSGESLDTSLFPGYFDVIRGEATIAVHDALKDPRMAGLVEGYILPLGILSILEAGVYSEGCLTGVICIESVDVARDWHPDEESFIAAVATFVGQYFSERKLHRAEERLRLALRSANQGTYDIDLNTGKVVVSDEYAAMLGYDPATFHETIQKWIERLHPGDAERAAAEFRDYLGGLLSDYQVEFRQRCADGTWKWILSLGSAVEWDGAGNPVRIVGTHTDISQVKELDVSLREREKQTRCLFEVGQALREASSDNPMPLNACADSLLRLLSTSDSMRVVLRHEADVVDNGFKGAAVPLFEAPILAGENRGPCGSLVILGPDSSEDLEPVRILDSEVIVLHEVIRLIEAELQRRATEREVLEKQTMLATAEGIANIGSWVYVVADNQLLWSDQTFSIFGIDPSEFGASYEAFLATVHPDDREAVYEAYEASQRKKSDGYDIRHRIIRADNGEVRHVHERCVHTRINGEVVRSIGTVQDVTEQEEASRRLLRESTMRAILQEAATLLASAPHEKADAAVEEALGIIGTFAHADRTYVIQFDWETQLGNNTHEWCADGVEPMIDHLRNVPMEETKELIDSIREGRPRWIPVVSALTNEKERDFLEVQGIQSILLMPLMHQGKCIGVVGFDWVHEERGLLESEVEILTVFSGLLVTHLGRVSAWRALEENEQRYRLLFSSMTQGVVIHDSTGAVIDCNKSAESILGFSRNMILGRDSHDPKWRAIREDGTPCPGDEHPAMVVLRTGQPCLGEVMGLATLESTRWIRINANPAVGADNDPIVFATFDDITAERESQAAIKMLASQVEQAPFPILRTGKDRRIVWGNAAFTQLTGYEISEVIGRKPGEFLQGPKTSTELVEKMRRQLDALETVSVEILNYSKSNVSYWIELTVAPLFDSDGKHTGYVGFERDVTERVRAQASLREATERLSALNDELENRVEMRTKEVRRQAAALELSFEGIAMYRHGHCIYRNAAHQGLFGEAGGRLGWREFIKPVSNEGLDPFTKQAEARMLEARSVGVDGRPLELEVDVIQLQDDVEVLMTRDITERNRSARELSKAKRFLETILDSFPIAVFWKDRDSRYLGCNSEFARWAGMEPSEVVGCCDQEMPWKGARAVEGRSEDCQVLDAGKKLLGITNHYLDNNGVEFWFEANKVPLRDENGTIIGVVGSFQDVTARIVAQRALQEREAKYRSLVENAGDMILTADAQGKLIEANQRAESFLGYTRSQLESMHMRDIHPPESLQSAITHFQAIIRDRSAVVRDIPMLRSDGSVVYADVTGNLIGIGDRIVVQGIFHDATERREREAALEEINRKLAEATRQKDEFLANMSHELRTPLNTVLGLSEALTLGIYGDLTERQIEMLNRIEFSGRHLLSLINDILDLAKIEAGRIVLEPEPVNVLDLVTSMSRLLEENSKVKGITLTTEVDDAAKEVVADPRRLRQILLNLLSNALKFTESGGSVELKTKLDHANGRLVFEVTDTGEGIPADKLNRLFLPFSQLESTLTKRHAGTGLGLSIVKRLTEMHGGSVSVVSSPGKGSTFSVSLPWIATSPSSASIPKTDTLVASFSPSNSTHRVLLVEDNDNNTALVCDFLTSTGYEVDVAVNGVEAIRKAGESKYSVILMDIQMPEMDGLEATRRIRLIPEQDKIPIIALTSFAMPGDRERCLNAGMNDYITKPVSLRALMVTIKAHLRNAPTRGVD